MTNNAIVFSNGDTRALPARTPSLSEQWTDQGRSFRWLLRYLLGCCPHCARRGSWDWSAETVIYRSSARSVTLQCKTCGLQWTMTAHQIAKAAQRWGLSPEMLQRFTAWADAVAERRGKSAQTTPQSR